MRLICTLGFTVSISASCRSNSFVLRNFSAKWMKAGGRGLRHGKETECRLLWHGFSLLPLASPADAYMQPNTAHHSSGALHCLPGGLALKQRALIWPEPISQAWAERSKKQPSLSLWELPPEDFYISWLKHWSFWEKGKINLNCEHFPTSSS